MMSPHWWARVFAAALMGAAWAAGVAHACPASCACKWKGGKQTVECVNQGLPALPAGVDPGTQVLDLTGNNLQTLGRGLFRKAGLLNLQRIYLSRCRLGHVDPDAFAGLTNLVELDLSENLMSEVPSESWKDASSLMRLTLSANPIRRLKSGAFRDLVYLTTLELSKCSVESVEEGTFDGLRSLEWLKLDSNRLSTVSGPGSLPNSLHGIDLHDNPWQCDCHLLDLRAWLMDHNVPYSIEPKCAYPERLSGESIKDLELDEFACFPDVSPTTMYLEIAEGKNVSLLCKVTAVPEARVSWWYQGRVLHNNSLVAPGLHLYYFLEEGSTHKRSELFILNTSREDNGTFVCVAENPAGRAQSNYTIRIVVRQEEPLPETFPFEYLAAIGAAIVVLAVLIIVAMVLLVVKCRRERLRRRKRERSKATSFSDHQHRKAVKSVQVGMSMSPGGLVGSVAGTTVAMLPSKPHRPNGSVVTVCEEMVQGLQEDPSARDPDLINDTESSGVKEKRRRYQQRRSPREDGDGEETDGSSRPGSYREAMENVINDYGEAAYESGGPVPADVHLLPSRFLDTEGYPLDYGLPKGYYPLEAVYYPAYPEGYPGVYPAEGCYLAEAAPYDLMPSPPAPYKGDAYLPRTNSSGLPYPPNSPPPSVVPGGAELELGAGPPSPPHPLSAAAPKENGNPVKSKVALLALQQNPIHESPDEGYEDEATEGTEI